MSRTSRWLFWILFSAGVAVRVIQFLHCRSLWCDEGHIAVNLLNRSYLGLLQPLDYHQGAPVGFLWSTRLLMSVLGPNEFALRGYSLICGILSLPVFYTLARNLYGAKAALLVLALMAFMPSLIGYSNEAKQYMGDVLWAGIVFWSTERTWRNPNLLRWTELSMLGLCALFFSHAAVFVLAGAGLFLAINVLLSPGRREFVIPLVVVGSIWIGALAADYFFLLRHLQADEDLLQYWAVAFAPFPPWTNLQWYPSTLSSFAQVTLGYKQSGFLGEGAILLGFLAAVFRRNWSDWLYLLPVVIAVLVSKLVNYPLLDRLMLWMTPSAILLIALGIRSIWNLPLGWARWTAPLLAFGVLAYPLDASFHLAFSRADKHEEIRAALEYLDRSPGPYDKIYFSRGTGTVLDFYLRTRSWHQVRREQLQPLDEYLTPESPTSGEAKEIGVVLGHIPIAQTEANLMGKLSTHEQVVGRFIDIGSEALVITAD